MAQKYVIFSKKQASGKVSSKINSNHVSLRLNQHLDEIIESHEILIRQDSNITQIKTTIKRNDLNPKSMWDKVYGALRTYFRG